MSKRNILALILTVSSLFLLYPGVTEPILQITISMDLPIIGKQTFYDQTQSILQTVQSLYKQDNKLVAVLIFLFSIVIPLTKAILVLTILVFKDIKFRPQLHRLVNVIGKWSMADVFVVAVFLAFLSTQSNSAIEAQLLSGFSYFTAYCLISLLGFQIAKIEET